MRGMDDTPTTEDIRHTECLSGNGTKQQAARLHNPAGWRHEQEPLQVWMQCRPADSCCESCLRHLIAPVRSSLGS